MHDFRLTCEQFLATTREHFFADEEGCLSEPDVPDNDATGTLGDTRHRLHAGG